MDTKMTTFYVAYPLFSLFDRKSVLMVDKAIQSMAAKKLHDIESNTSINNLATFLPFRDTIQSHGATDDPELRLTEAIYRADINKLNDVDGLIALFDGLAKDEGISVEIGYAYALGKPIVIVVSDFISHILPGQEDKPQKLDPIVSYMASAVVSSAHRQNVEEIEYEAGLDIAISDILDSLKEAIGRILNGGAPNGGSAPAPRHSSFGAEYDFSVHVEFGGGLFQWQRELSSFVNSICQAKGIVCTTSARYEPLDVGKPRDRGSSLAPDDILNAERATLVIFCSDSHQMDSGSAALLGFCKAKGKKTILLDSKTTSIAGSDGYSSSRNLMVDYSADVVVRSKNILADYIVKFRDNTESI